MGVICGIVTSVIGAILVVVVSIVGYVIVPGIIENTIINEVTLINDTIQLERFKEVPFPLNFTVRMWNVTNRDEVLAGGVPALTETGAYIYKLYQGRILDEVDGDNITYRLEDHFEFDPIASYPYTEDDIVTMVNPAYHAVLQIAETILPGNTMGTLLNPLLGSIFGEFNSPITNFRVRSLLFDGIPICQNPGIIVQVVCGLIRSLGEDVQNIFLQEDGALLFSVLAYRDGKPSKTFTASRGLNDHGDLGRIHSYNDLPNLRYWKNPEEEAGGGGVCNMINGTDSGIFAPFLTKNITLYALNTDICRSVALRYQNELEYEGIPALRYAANEWFLNNDEECFCLNVTHGINLEDGCLLRGAMELFTCTGANLVLTYPHFLFGDLRYRNGVIGMNPDFEQHRIFLDLEPNTGTLLRGAKRAQFNIFMRPVAGITATDNLRTTLMPIAWIEEGMSLPEEFVNELKSKLLKPLNLVRILIPILIAVCALVLVIGLAVIVIHTIRKGQNEK